MKTGEPAPRSLQGSAGLGQGGSYTHLNSRKSLQRVEQTFFFFFRSKTCSRLIEQLF